MIHHGNNMDIDIPNESIDLIYTDPPYNTGYTQKRGRLSYDDYISFIEPRLRKAYRLLKPTGSLMLHLDYREVHYCKVLLDEIFGRDCFRNEIIWSYDYGGKPKTRGETKHDTILWNAKDGVGYFDYDAIDRIPYMSAGRENELKVPTDVWWCTIVPTRSKEKTGYPTQKPLRLMKRIVRVHSRMGDTCLDMFAGSGSFGVACKMLHRNYILIDNSIEAINIMKGRGL